MELNEYQEHATKTAKYTDNLKTRLGRLAYVGLGLAGESGEVANKIKKTLRGDIDLNDPDAFAKFRADMVAELGDSLWYISQTGRELGITMEEIGQANIEKLRSRLDRNVIQGAGDNR